MPFTFPVVNPTRISSGFGTRSSPGGIGSTNHQGIDIAAPTGSAVVAPTDIEITQAGWGGGYGNLVRGVDAAGNTYEFGHLNTIDVSRGDTLSAGQQLGTVGSTGKSTGPHLHFGIKDAAGKFIDPSRLLANAKQLGNKALDLGKKLLGDKAKDLAKAVAMTNPVGAAAVTAGEALGLFNDECGTLDFVCKLKRWFEKADFFQRLAMVIVSIIFLVAAFALLSRSQLTRQISTIAKG